MIKTALVLGGGGSRGSYQIGVWQALKELDINIDIVTGTSVGALNSALICIGDFENAISLWKSMKTSMVLDIDLDEELSMDKKVKTVIKTFMSDYVRQGGTDAYPLKQLIMQYVCEDKMRQSPISCGMVVVDKSTLKPLELYIEDIKAGQLGDYLLASSSLFPAMKSCNIEGTDYIDGGYYDNLPVELALKKGADKIIAVDLESIGMIRRGIIKKTQNLTTIKCYWDLGPILLFDNETILKNIRLGYLDTMKAFGVFDGIAYAFSKNEIPIFIKHNKDKIESYNQILGLKYSSEFKDLKDSVFHLKIITHIQKKYKKVLKNHYSSFLKSAIESAGEIFNIDCTKIYTLEIFNKRLHSCMNELEIPYIKSEGSAYTKNVKHALSLLNKKMRTIYLASNIKNAYDSGSNSSFFVPALFLPDEFLAAYYISMLD